MQRLLYNYVWDADLVRDDLRDYVVEHLGDANGVLVVDETGFLENGIPGEGKQVGGGAASVQWDGGPYRELPGRDVPDLRCRPGEGPAGPAGATGNVARLARYAWGRAALGK